MMSHVEPLVMLWSIISSLVPILSVSFSDSQSHSQTPKTGMEPGNETTSSLIDSPGKTVNNVLCASCL